MGGGAVSCFKMGGMDRKCVVNKMDGAVYYGAGWFAVELDRYLGLDTLIRVCVWAWFSCVRMRGIGTCWAGVVTVGRRGIACFNISCVLPGLSSDS